MPTELPESSPLRKLASRQPLYAAMTVKLTVDLAAYGAKRWLGLDLPTEALVAWFVATLGVATVAAHNTVWSPASVEQHAADARQEGANLAVEALAKNDLEAIWGPPDGRHSAGQQRKRRSRPPAPDAPTRHIPEDVT